MKTFLTSASSAAIVLCLAATASAESVSLSDTIGEPIIDQMQSYANGNWVNRAINNAEIDGSISINNKDNIEQIQRNIDLETSNIDSESNDGGALFGANTIVDKSSYLIDRTGNAIAVSTDTLSTTAIGAVNSGQIAADQNKSYEFSKVSNITASMEADINSESSAEASATSAQATSAAGEIINSTFKQLSEDKSYSTLNIASGPASGYYSVNEAFNSGNINASVSIKANGTELAGVSTVAAGAVNTGTLSIGFDGSAFNSAVNGGGDD